MMRTEHGLVRSLYEPLFNDGSRWLPQLDLRSSESLSRIESMVKSRGLRVVMIDFPEACRVLDRGLSSGYLDSTKLPKTLGSWKKGTILFAPLWYSIFTMEGILAQQPDPTNIFFLRQFLLLLKKVRKDPTDEAISDSVREFLQIDLDLRVPSYRWNRVDPQLVFHQLDFEETELFRDCPITGCKGLLRVLQAVCRQTISLFPEVDLYELYPQHGPGAVADQKSGNDKYAFPTWSKKLDSFFFQEFFAKHCEFSDLPYGAVRADVESPARLLAVPKTLKGPRLIASEPTANQWCQQALLKWIRKYLPYPLSRSISFLDQRPSQEWAVMASLTEDFATVDLSAASDRLSCWAVERAFGANQSLLQALMHSRTHFIESGVPQHAFEPFGMKKFAAMGSAVTFPVQSIFYALCCYAVLLYEDDLDVNARNIIHVAEKVRVFGDDIILPSRHVEILVRLLDYLQLKVNVSKTHWRGRFRESCGMDAYGGYSVTPVYMRDLLPGKTPKSIVSWVAVSNNCYREGLWALSDWMWEQVPQYFRGLCPTSNKDLGVVRRLTYQDVTIASKKREGRESPLHREEVLGYQVTSHSVQRRRTTADSLLQYYTEAPSQLIDWESGYIAVNRLRLRRRWVPV